MNNDPILNEPGVTKTHHDYSKYDKIIEYKNIDIAILKVLNKNPGVYMEKFDCFYPDVKEQFLKNKDEIHKFLEEKQKEFPTVEKITTSLYNMSVIIDYEKLYKDFRCSVEKLSPYRKCIPSFVDIGFTGTKKGIGKMGMIYRIGMYLVF